MRILITTGVYAPDIGGPATYSKLIKEELPKLGIAVSVLPFTKFRKLPKILRHLAYLCACAFYAIFVRAEVIYAQDPVSVGLPSMLVAKFLLRKFAIRVAGDYAWEQSAQRFGVSDTVDEFQTKKYDWKTELLRIVQSSVVSNANLVITPSKYFQKLVGGWVSDPGKVQVIYNGIKFESKFIATRSLNTLLSVGRLVPWKGFDFLIKLMADPAMADLKLRIVGDGPDKERLLAIVEEFGLGKRVELIGDVDRDRMLEEYLPNAGMFILNTKFESFSFVVVEAMNAGIPVVATNIGSIPELVESDKEGILVEPDNKNQVLSAIQKIRSDAHFRNDIVLAAHAKAQEFSIERTVSRLAEELRKLHN